MITITTWPDLRAAIELHRAGAILSAHADRFQEFDDQPLADLCEFIIVEPGDRFADLQAKLGRSLDPPPWEYADRSGGFYELVLITGDDGFGFVVLVEDRPETDPALLDHCRALTT